MRCAYGRQSFKLKEKEFIVASLAPAVLHFPMKAFWWYEERVIAGIARPGFNANHWNDFSFEESVLIGWIGQHSSGSGSLADFQAHVQTYGAKIAKFYTVDPSSSKREIAALLETKGIEAALARLAARTGLLEEFGLEDSRKLRPEKIP